MRLPPLFIMVELFTALVLGLTIIGMVIRTVKLEAVDRRYLQCTKTDNDRQCQLNSNHRGYHKAWYPASDASPLKLKLKWK